MKEENRTRSQLIKELAELRQRVAELEKPKAQDEHTKDLFESLLQSSPIGIYIAQDGRFRLCNLRFQQFTGYSEKELLGRDPFDFVIPEDRNRVRENAVKMLKGELSLPYEFRVRIKSGEILWVMETVTSIQYQGRRATLENFMNISQLKRAEEKLQEREAQYRGIFSSATDSFLIFDLKGNIVEANPQACTMHGYAYDELIKLSGKDIIHPDYF
ncbi:MAG: PAS domain S-box protein, partial [Pseudomonadota bacterium]